MKGLCRRFHSFIWMKWIKNNLVFSRFLFLEIIKRAKSRWESKYTERRERIIKESRRLYFLIKYPTGKSHFNDGTFSVLIKERRTDGSTNICFFFFKFIMRSFCRAISFCATINEKGRLLCVASESEIYSTYFIRPIMWLNLPSLFIRPSIFLVCCVLFAFLFHFLECIK